MSELLPVSVRERPSKNRIFFEPVRRRKQPYIPRSLEVFDAILLNIPTNEAIRLLDIEVSLSTLKNGR